MTRVRCDAYKIWRPCQSAIVGRLPLKQLGATPIACCVVNPERVQLSLFMCLFCYLLFVMLFRWSAIETQILLFTEEARCFIYLINYLFIFTKICAGSSLKTSTIDLKL